MRAIVGIISGVAQFLAAISALLVALMLLLVVCSVVMRYAIGSPFRFTEELVGVAVFASIFLALPLIKLKGQDIQVTALRGALPSAAAKIIAAAAHVFVLLFLVLFGWDIWKRLWFAFRLNLATDVSRISIWPWLTVMLVSIIMVALVTLLDIRRQRGERS